MGIVLERWGIGCMSATSTDFRVKGPRWNLTERIPWIELMLARFKCDYGLDYLMWPVALSLARVHRSLGSYLSENAVVIVAISMVVFRYWHLVFWSHLQAKFWARNFLDSAGGLTYF